MSKMPAFQFYPADWRKSPDVQALSFFDKGIWIEILCLMHESEKRGYLIINGHAMSDEIISNILGLQITEWQRSKDNLISLGVCSVDSKSSALFSRRMVRDTKSILEYKKLKSKAGKKSAISNNHNNIRGLNGKFSTEQKTEHNTEQPPNPASAS